MKYRRRAIRALQRFASRLLLPSQFELEHIKAGLGIRGDRGIRVGLQDSRQGRSRRLFIAGTSDMNIGQKMEPSGDLTGGLRRLGDQFLDFADRPFRPAEALGVNEGRLRPPSIRTPG